MCGRIVDGLFCVKQALRSVLNYVYTLMGRVISQKSAFDRNYPLMLSENLFTGFYSGMIRKCGRDQC
ncbi:Uncharacterised protein [Serratia proteamaculans]|nr:Uncharacterised protein [Serratia proteamaculans]